MNELGKAFLQALELILARDPEIMEIAGRSLRIAATSTSLASLICVPVGGLIHFRAFSGRRIVINVIQTLYSLPTVAVGLLVFITFSRSGPLGGLGIIFTPIVMVIGQMLLISPILLGLTISALSGVDRAVKDTARSLGATETQALWAIVKEARFGVMSAVIMGFGRAISEVGLSLMVGGNIRGYTRVLTTAISLETQKGELVLAIALGIILIGLALLINVGMNLVQQRYR